MLQVLKAEMTEEIKLRADMRRHCCYAAAKIETRSLQQTQRIPTFVDCFILHSAPEYAGEAVALNQHHDAVTGTAKQVVTNDYCRHLSKGLSHCEAS